MNDNEKHDLFPVTLRSQVDQKIPELDLDSESALPYTLERPYIEARIQGVVNLKIFTVVLRTSSIVEIKREIAMPDDLKLAKEIAEVHRKYRGLAPSQGREI